MAWAVLISGEEDRGQKARAVQRPRGQTVPSEDGGQQGDPWGWSGGSGEGSPGDGGCLIKADERLNQDPHPPTECLTGSEQPTGLISRPLGPAWYQARWLPVTHPK